MSEPKLLRACGLRILAACLAAGLLGCGQKGPLQLPEKSGAVVVKPAAGSPAPQDEAESRAGDER